MVTPTWTPLLQVCLSISSHHPEHWQPSWSLRTALVALIAFMQTPGNGAIGSLVRATSDFDASGQHQVVHSVTDWVLSVAIRQSSYKSGQHDPAAM
jgi:ubiquitin-protein ligase